MRRTQTIRRGTALIAAPALLLALAACGGSDTDKAADEPTSASSAATSDDPADESSSAPAEAAEPGEGTEVDKDEFLDTMKASMESATTAHTSMEMGTAAGTMSVDGEVDYTTTPPSMAMKMTNPAMGGADIDIRMLDGVMYMNMGQMSQNKFYKVDLDDPNGPMGDMSSMTDSLDPVKAFEEYAAGLDTVTFVGEEDVEGESLKHYTMVLDTSKIGALDQLDPSAAASLPEKLDYDLWLDDSDRMRQVKMDLGTAGGEMTMKIFDWDAPVEIKAPPANEIAELPATQ